MNLNLKRILKATPTIKLAALHFDIVGSCQLRCVGCPNSTIQNKVTRIEPAAFATCLRNIDVDHVAIFRLFNYGESLLHHDLPGIFDELERAPRFSIGFFEMSTNAQSVHWDQLTDVLQRQRVDRLVVSCDGDGTPASYERMRPPARWEKLIAFLTRAREIRDRYCPRMDLMTRTVIFNQTSIAAWNDVLRPLGWRPEFRRWINLVGASENLSERSWQPGIGLCPFVGMPLTLYVDWNGSVVPCCAHPRAGNFGNLNTEKWSTIYSGENRHRFLQQLARERPSMEICSKCEFGSQTDLNQYLVPDDEALVANAAADCLVEAQGIMSTSGAYEDL